MIGSLNKRIEIQAPTKVKDSMGGFVMSWFTIHTVYAALWPISAIEIIQAMQGVMTITHRIRIRYKSVLKPNWRIKFGNRYFNIVGIINPSESNEWLDIMAKESV